eukprot:158733-Pelagomonas_calceolata.AAC.1
MLKTARIPSSWKAVKLAPIYKKGTVTPPSNYRMLAVSNTLHRLYTNVLRSMVQDWCAKYNIIPDSQFGFFSRPQHLTATFYLEALKACSSDTSTSRLPTFICHLY